MLRAAVLPYEPAEVLDILRSAASTTPDTRLDEVLESFARQWRALAAHRFRALGDAVDDVVQDALVSIVSPGKLAQVGDPRSAVTWARAVFANRCHDYLRERLARTSRRVDLSDDEDDHEDVL